MAEQPHTSLRSPCAMPSVSWSAVKLTAIGLWSSGNGLSRVMNHVYHLAVERLNLGLADARRTLPAWIHSADCKVWWRRNNGLGMFFMVRIGSLVLVKGNLNVTAYNDSLDGSVLPTLWQQFGKGTFRFQVAWKSMSSALYFAQLYTLQSFTIWQALDNVLNFSAASHLCGHNAP